MKKAKQEKALFKANIKKGFKLVRKEERKNKELFKYGSLNNLI